MTLWKLSLRGLVCLVSLLTPLASNAATITFEGTEYSGLTGSISGNLYQSEGVIFTNDSLQDLVYFKNGYSGILGTEEYSIAFGPSSRMDYGVIRATFFDPRTLATATVNSVSLWAGDASIESEDITLTAFSLSGEQLDVADFTTGVQPGHAASKAQLSVSAEKIAYVEIRSSHTVSMDDFTFDTPVKTPESSPLLSIGVGLAGLCALKNKTKRDRT